MLAAEESANSTQTILQVKSKTNQHGEIKIKKSSEERRKVVGGKGKISCMQPIQHCIHRGTFACLCGIACMHAYII